MKTRLVAPRFMQPVLDLVLPDRRHASAIVRRVSPLALKPPSAHSMIAELIRGGQPFAVTRPGGTESEGLKHFLKKRTHQSPNSKQSRYPRFFLENATNLSGITYRTSADLDEFCAEYLSGIAASDILIFGRFAPGALEVIERFRERGKEITDPSAVEPFFAAASAVQPWTSALKGKRVLVVHPFSKSIERQFARKGEIETVNKLMPDFELITAKPPVTFAGEPNTSNWLQSLMDFNLRIQAIDFDVALIAAGGYGLPLAARVRDMGRGAIHYGGALQLLFGIRGKRWESDPRYQAFFGPNWVKPSLDETPHRAQSVEHGAYW